VLCWRHIGRPPEIHAYGRDIWSRHGDARLIRLSAELSLSQDFLGFRDGEWSTLQLETAGCGCPLSC
jgi:hypothetical protein